MTKNKKHYICNACGCISYKWQGQCFECNSWGSITEEITNTSKDIAKHVDISLLDDNVDNLAIYKTTINELDNILGGGLFESSVVLIGGDPGIGKSTLLLQLAALLPKNGLECLYVTGEESLNQIKLRAKRLGINNGLTNILAHNNIEGIIATLELHKERIKIVIIDSIQTMSSQLINGIAGTVSQIKFCSQELISYAKCNNIILFIACHVTKEGQFAGPKILEHMVDTVLYFEGDHNNDFRILRTTKNRFGSVNEVGVFEMTDKGLKEVANPSSLFLSDRGKSTTGSAIFAGIEGTRSLLIEVQALIAPSHMATPRRSVVGWDLNRLSMIIAVLNVRFGLNLATHEVYLTIIGGLKIVEPAADLAVVAALISAAKNITIPFDSIFFGEIGLGGEVRKVSKSDIRIKEARKMGFERIFCAEDNNTNSLINTVTHIKDFKTILR